METNPTNNQILDHEVEYQRASRGKRFANYLIDLIAFYIVIMILSVFMFVSSPEMAESVAQEDAGTDLLVRFIALIIYALFMSILEAAMGGKSLGKLITRTRAVNLDGSPITAKTAFARGFSRAVPFCVFSALGDPCNPWQDSWTDTMVIDETKTAQ